VDNAFLTATVVALLNVVPYIGPFMGGTMIVIFTMLGGIGQPDMIYTTLYVLGGFLLIQLFDNFISQPVIFSSSVKAHPLEIFTVTLIGGTLMGIIGMIVAVPLYTLVRIIAKEFFWEFKIVRVFTKDI
jgi:predicted PurR-regulated permease PerM